MTADEETRRDAANMPVPSFASTPLTVPPRLAAVKVAIVTTGGLLAEGQEAWKRGEETFRVLPRELRSFRMGHWSLNFDRSGFSSDVNVLYPIDRLEELAAEGIIGSVAPRHLSFMGALDETMSSIRLDSGPAAAKLLKDDGVNVVVLSGA